MGKSNERRNLGAKEFSMSIRYADIVPWGRSFDEYCDMFLLSEEDLKSRILCVGDGPASFNARMRSMGRTVTSVDPTYILSTEEFSKRITETYNLVMQQTKRNLDKFVWTRIQNIEELCRIRLCAMNEFCSDYELGKTEGRYIPASLPLLPFQSKSYDLILTAHLLFFYSDNCDREFHLLSIGELIRLGKEVRIFPLVDLNSERSLHLDAVLSDLTSMHIHFSIEKVRYHFQKTGTEMLRIFNT
jgi:hypothetical protein